VSALPDPDVCMYVCASVSNVPNMGKDSGKQVLRLIDKKVGSEESFMASCLHSIRRIHWPAMYALALSMSHARHTCASCVMMDDVCQMSGCK
jgi:hypothetical protein